MSLPAGKVHFKADKEWKEVLPHHVLPNGLEAEMVLKMLAWLLLHSEALQLTKIPIGNVSTI